MLFLGHKNGIMMVETTVEATTTIVEVGITMVEVITMAEVGTTMVEVITMVEVGTTMVEDITIMEVVVEGVVVEEVCGKISPISSYYDRH
jgi:hypothetical protein